MNSQEDAFASAGLVDSGMQSNKNMMSGASDLNFGPQAEDYTEEELVML